MKIIHVVAGYNGTVLAFTDKARAESVAARMDLWVEEAPLDSEAPDSWPPGRPYEVCVLEKQFGRATVSVYVRDALEDFELRDEGWQSSGNTNWREHRRIVWALEREQAEDAGQARAQELQRLPFDR